MLKQLIDTWQMSPPMRIRFLPLTVTVVLLTWMANGCSTMNNHTGAQVHRTIPSAEVAGRHRQAVLLMQEEQWVAAVAMLEGLTAQQPELSGPWLNLGIAYTKRGNTRGAESAFKQAIDANATNIEAYNQLGILYRRSGRLEEARHLYETALELDHDNSRLHWNLAILHDTYLPAPRKALLHYQRYQQITGSDNPQLQSWIDSLEKDTQINNMTAKVNP